MVVTMAHSPEFETILIDNEEGLLPLRLIEPIASLQLTPFAAKAAKATGAMTVGDLATLVFEQEKTCRGLGQGHIEEIRRKIELFVGVPPYKKEQTIDLPALLRLCLFNADSLDRAIIIIQCRLQQLAPLTIQESREGEMALLRQKDVKFQKAIETCRSKVGDRTKELLGKLGEGFVQNWASGRGGVIHESELYQFLYERGTPMNYGTFELAWKTIENISGTTLPATFNLFPIEKGLWARSPKEQSRALTILQDAHTLRGSTLQPTNLKGLAQAIMRCRFQEWENCSSHFIERLLFFSYSAF